jgi:two-component system, NarL family, nitrate/nitrite response regulator NarL
MTRTRLLLVDDHVLFREGLSRLLASEPDCEIVGACGSAAEALQILKSTRVDVVLLDYDLNQDRAGVLIAAARRAAYTGKILMVTAGMSAKESSGVLKLGVSGIILKHNPPGLLATAIRRVSSGELWLDPKIVQLMADEVGQGPEDAPVSPSLTERERQVLQGVFEGLGNKEIAARLGISEGAVKSALQQLFQKTHVRTRSQLVRMALEGSLGMPAKP